MARQAMSVDRLMRRGVVAGLDRHIDQLPAQQPETAGGVARRIAGEIGDQGQGFQAPVAVVEPARALHRHARIVLMFRRQGDV